MAQTVCAAREKEAFISAAKYQARFARGEIGPQKTRIELPDRAQNLDGSFLLQLPTPRNRQPQFPPFLADIGVCLAETTVWMRNNDLRHRLRHCRNSAY